MVLEATLLRRMYHRPLDTLLVTWGVSLVLQQLARDVFGTAGVDVPAPGWLSGPVEVLGFAFPRTRLFILLLAVAAFLALAAALRYTALGRRIRATVQNRPLAESAGHLHPGHRPPDVLHRVRARRRRGRGAHADGLDLAEPRHRPTSSTRSSWSSSAASARSRAR